jgi:hypothetical protein
MSAMEQQICQRNSRCPNLHLTLQHAVGDKRMTM